MLCPFMWHLAYFVPIDGNFGQIVRYMDFKLILPNNVVRDKGRHIASYYKRFTADVKQILGNVNEIERCCNINGNVTPP